VHPLVRSGDLLERGGEAAGAALRLSGKSARAAAAARFSRT
jgi:hypothetical protein